MPRYAFWNFNRWINYISFISTGKNAKEISAIDIILNHCIEIESYRTLSHDNPVMDYYSYESIKSNLTIHSTPRNTHLRLLFLVK